MLQDPWTAVLIHGCHLQADLNGQDWERIVWGLSPDGVPTLEGRATMGIQIARDYDAGMIIFSTGASEKDGMKEGAYTYTWAITHVDLLAPVYGLPPEELLLYLTEMAELDLESQNTREELERNFRLCVEMGFSRIILVSSAWHIERCHAEALKVARSMRAAGKTVPEIVAIGDHSDTAGIVILEPPHRGDRPKTRFHQLARHFFQIPNQKLEWFYGAVATLLRGIGIQAELN